MRRRRGFVIALLALVILAVGAGLALSRLRDAEAGRPAGGGEVSSRVSAGPVEFESVSTAPAVKVTTTSPTHRTTSAAPGGPAISFFRVSVKPSCPSGTDQVQNPGQDVTLEWKVTGAEKATISLDGPGIYDTYGAEDSVTLNFPCSGDPGSYQSHKYLLTAIGPEGTKTRTLTVKAEVNEITTT
ncbi:hypothetical protein [Actinoplanes sp. NPDC020271]|uniref:hypothetical protein n=1 Tax=Actinoplanes sp. NPDC020271 TaxID=3363896 RepID=UPI00378FD549